MESTTPLFCDEGTSNPEHVPDGQQHPCCTRGGGGDWGIDWGQCTLGCSKFGGAPPPNRDVRFSDLEVSANGDIAEWVANACAESRNIPDTF